MEPCRCLALVSALVALSIDIWFVAVGPSSSAHSGLWPKGGFIHVIQTFSILAALCGLVSVSLLVLSCIPSLSASGCGLLGWSITAFVADFFTMTNTSIYSGYRLSQPEDPQILSFISWSFYLGWVSTILWFTAGCLGLVAHSRALRPG